MNISPINSVNFGSKSKLSKEKKQREYVKTNTFKIAGAAIGSTAALGGVIGKLIARDKMQISMLGTIGIGLGVAVISAFGGAIQDYKINKTVKNTVESLNLNQD